MLLALALRMGRTVRELQAAMTSSEIAEALAFLRLEPQVPQGKAPAPPPRAEPRLAPASRPATDRELSRQFLAAFGYPGAVKR